MTGGVLHTPSGPQWRLRRWDVPDNLAAIAGCGWASEWRLPASASHRQSVLPHPVANLVLEDGALTLHGPASKRFDRTLRGTGRVLGVRFRPAVLQLLTGRRAAELVDRTLPAAAIGLAEIADELLGIDDTDRAVRALLAAVAEAFPAGPGPPVAELRDGVELVERDDGVDSVDELAARLLRSRRTLQRQFADHVGVSPAWVLRRYRLRRALDEASGEQRPDWASIAHRVGYYDQAHLVRDFGRTVGTPPQRYTDEGGH